MNDIFINELIMKLSGKLSENDLKMVKMALEAQLVNYDVVQRSTGLAVTYDHYPESVKIYLATRSIEGMSKTTMSLYERTLRLFFEDLRRPVEEIRTNDIRVYLYRYKEERGVSNRTLDKTRGIIATFFSWAKDEGYIEKDPCSNIKPIKYQIKPRGSLTEMELEQIRSACSGPRETAIIELFYSTGCRVSEVISIKTSDVDFQNSTITVTGKGNKVRKVYLNAKAVFALKKYLFTRNDDCEYLITTERKPFRQLAKRTLEEIVEKIGVRAELDQKLYPHLLRHTTATLGLKHGMDVTQVQKLLGHSQISTTMIYADVADATVKTAHEKALA